MKKILDWIERHRLESTAVVVILSIATYCSVTLTTNAAVDSLNEALSELQQQVEQRQTQAEQALRGAVLDAYPSLLRGERAYNARLRHGEDALSDADHVHVQVMQEVLDHYRPVMQAALRSGVSPFAMRRHMEGLIVSDSYAPEGMQHIAATQGEQPDQI